MGLLKDFFIYQVDFAGLASGASSTSTFNIQADANFRWEKFTYFADIAAAGQTENSRVIPLVTILVTDTGSGRNLMDSAMPLSSIAGTGTIPFILQMPKIFAARSTVTITLTNFDAANTYNVRLSFLGTKIFNISG